MLNKILRKFLNDVIIKLIYVKNLIDEDYYRPFRIYNKNEIYKSIEMKGLEIDLGRIFYFLK